MQPVAQGCSSRSEADRCRRRGTMTRVLYDAVARTLAKSCAAGCERIVRMRLRRRSGPRSLQRVCIVAPLGHEKDGIAAGALLQFQAMRRAGMDVAMIDATAALEDPLFRRRHRPATVYVVHGEGPQTARLLGAVLPHAAQAWRIAYWNWDLAHAPADWLRCDSIVSEIWTPSLFARSSLQQISDRPMHVVPPIVTAADPPRRRNWSQPFTVLVMAGSTATLQRTNPAGAIAAFIAAFGDARDARLVVRLADPAHRLGDLTSLAAFPNVSVLDGRMNPTELSSLYRSADVLLSLHRSIGFGFPLLEAMSHGVPVVATHWSGNCDFVNWHNAVLVPYRLVPMTEPVDQQAGGVWAEPDIGFAAGALRRLRTDPQYYEALASAAYETVRDMEFHLPSQRPAPDLQRDRLRAKLLSQLGVDCGHTRALL